MSLATNFRKAALPTTARRAAPFSIRLSSEDRARLTLEAGDVPLGAYIKGKVLGTASGTRKRRKMLAIKDREALAQTLALLGRSHLANNLNQIAHAVNIGVLPVTPETEEELRAALNDVRQVRHLLISALGFQPGGAP